MMPAGNCLCKQSYQRTHVSTVSSEPICVNACALTWSKCSSHIMHVLTAGCPLNAKLRFVSWHDTESLFIAEIQQFLQGIRADAEVLR